MTTRGPGKGSTDPQWWKKDKSDIYIHIFETVANLWNQTSERRERNVRCMRLYGSREVAGFSPYSMSPLSLALPQDRVKVNVIASMVDTVSAKISKIRPRISFLTEGGDYEAQEKAKDLSKFMEGVFYANEIHRLHQAGFRDGAVVDLGAIKHYIDGDQIKSERVLANEIFVDDVDAMYGKPKSLYQVKFLHKDVLKQMFPKKAASIQMASNTLNPQISTAPGTEDYVAVIEAWHLPSGKGAGDGKHVICMDNDWLAVHEYERDYFPFTFFRWSPGLIGFFGDSLANRLTGNQVEINKMLRVIQRSFNLGSSFKVFLERGSKIAKETLSNEIGGIIEYTGTAPTYYVPKVISSEYFEHLQFLIQSSYEEAGVSQLSAQSKKPSGLDSGKALREYNDIETERFAIVSQEYERTFLETSRIYIDLVKEMYDSGVDYEAQAESKKFIEKLKWSDVAVEGNEFIMKAFPVSMLPHTPAGRLQWVQELINEGFIPKDYGLKLLDFPDTEAYSSMINAPMDDLSDTLSKMLRSGKYSPPDPMQDLVSGMRMFHSAYLRGRSNGTPDKKLDLLRRWIAQAGAMIKKAEASQQPAPEQAAPQGQPPIQ